MDKKVIDKNRRNFIKALAFGGGAIVLGKLFGSSIVDLFYGPSVTKDFKQFNVTENRKTFTISSKDGEPLFVMDNEK